MKEPQGDIYFTDRGEIVEYFTDAISEYDAVYTWNFDGAGCEVYAYDTMGSAFIRRDDFPAYVSHPARKAVLLIRALRDLFANVELDVIQEVVEVTKERDEVQESDDGPVDGGESEEDTDLASTVKSTLGEGHGPDSDCPTCRLIFDAMAR